MFDRVLGLFYIETTGILTQRGAQDLSSECHIDLHQFQENALRSAVTFLDEGKKVVLQLPTGAGKTRVAARLISEWDKAAPIWFVCHRREIIRQAADRTFSAFGIDHAIASSSYKPDYANRVQVATIQTLRWRRHKLPEPGLIVWDECHHIAAPLWAKVMSEFSGAKHIGLTATPERLDGKGLDRWFDELVTGPTIRGLIDAGYLSDFRMLVPSQPDLTAAKIITGGDYRLADLEKIMDTPALVGDALDHYQRETPGHRAICFASSVKHSIDIVNAFRAAGIPSAHVDATTPVGERDEAVAALEDGRIKLLSNYGVFTEGFDLPAIDAVILMRPTKSLGLFLQMCGRGLRRNGSGKRRVTFFDHSGLYYEHGLPDANWQWTLSGGAKARRAAEMRARNEYTRLCPECLNAHPASPKCPECGYEYPFGMTVGVFDGRLREPDSKVAPEGRESISRFARRLSVSSGTAKQWILKGLPVDDLGFVKVREALDWTKTNGLPMARGKKAGGAPEGHVTKSQFARVTGHNPRMVAVWRKWGMPQDRSGFIPAAEGAEWYRSLISDITAYDQLRADGFVTPFELSKVLNRGHRWVMNCIKIGMPHRGFREMSPQIILLNAEESQTWISGRHDLPEVDSFESWSGVIDRYRQEVEDQDKAEKERLSRSLESSASFAKRTGVSRQLVSLWCKEGMPREGGKINIEEALAWLSSKRQRRGGRSIPDTAWPSGKPLGAGVGPTLRDVGEYAATHPSNVVFRKYLADFSRQYGYPSLEIKDALRDAWLAEDNLREGFAA